MISRDLLDILICPACGEGAVVLPDESDRTLVCSRCGRRYPVREGIPVMLVDEAAPPTSEAPLRQP
ncbi:MAG: Trm112 family protein [Lentisphaerae bacterium]|nr:Trm112 family protein [Lentisphaerota bacterium]